MRLQAEIPTRHMMMLFLCLQPTVRIQVKNQQIEAENALTVEPLHLALPALARVWDYIWPE